MLDRVPPVTLANGTGRDSRPLGRRPLGGQAQRDNEHRLLPHLRQRVAREQGESKPAADQTDLREFPRLEQELRRRR